MAQGVGDSQRIGRKIRVKRITIRYQFSRDNELAVTAGFGQLAPGTCAFMFLQDKQANGALPAAGDVLEDTSTVRTMNELSNSNRFRTLFRKDAEVPTGPISAHWDGTNTVYTMKGGLTPVQTWSGALDFPVQYTGVGATVAEIASNNIVFMTYCDHDYGSTRVYVRVRYTDL